MFVTNHPTIVKAAKKCYAEYPTVVNQLKESGITYNNTRKEYARMDNKFAKSQRYIGESSNLAQLAMTYYWTDRAMHKEFTFRSKELYDNFVILAVLAQVVIDGCKREYEIDAPTEIERIKRLPSMSIKKEVIVNGKVKYVRCDFPKFMKYTKDVPVTQNGNELPYEEIKQGRDKINNRINENLVCPMNYLQDWLDKIQGIERKEGTNIKDFFIKMEGVADNRQMSKIREMVEKYSNYISNNYRNFDSDDGLIELSRETDKVIKDLKKMRIGNSATINRLIETALGIDEAVTGIKYLNATKNTRKMLNLLYRMNKDRFLSNFCEKMP